MARSSALALALSITTAHVAQAAPVIYQFIPSTAPPVPLTITLTIDDAAVARGAFALGITWPGQLSGDVEDFQYLAIKIGPVNGASPMDSASINEPFRGPSGPGDFYAASISLSFDPTGQVIQSSLWTEGFSEDVTIGGAAGGYASGTYITDFRPCNNSRAPCAIEGNWIDPPASPRVASSIPESSTMVLLLSFLGIGLVAWVMTPRAQGRRMFQ